MFGSLLSVIHATTVFSFTPAHFALFIFVLFRQGTTSIQLNEGLVDRIKNITKLTASLDQFEQLITAIRSANSLIFDKFKVKVCS